MRVHVSFFALALTVASSANAQTPPPAPPCDSASVLMTAKPVFNVGTTRIREACPAFARAIADWYARTPAVASMTSAQVIAAILAGVAPAPTPPPSTLDPRPSPPTGNAPEPAASSVVLFRDEFERPAASIAAGYAKRGVMTATDGHTGSGAIRFPYGPSSSDNVVEKVFAEARDVYVRFWYRLSPGADPACGGANGSGFKWFMASRANDAPRYTMGVTLLGQGNAGLDFATHDNSSARQPNPFLQNKTKTPRFGTTNDGQWHKYTLHLVTGDAGYEQLWVDDVLVLDNRGLGYDHAAVGIVAVLFPGNMVSWPSGCSPFTVDVDDLVVWRG